MAAKRETENRVLYLRGLKFDRSKIQVVETLTGSHAGSTVALVRVVLACCQARARSWYYYATSDSSSHTRGGPRKNALAHTLPVRCARGVGLRMVSCPVISVSIRLWAWQHHTH